jgi:hypothetical protein
MGSTSAGALALLAAPIAVIAGVLIQPTLSDDAPTQVTALTSHHQAMITGMTLSIIALVLLIAGTLWLALALAPRAPRLAIAGAVLGVFGALVVLFENSVTAAAPAIAALKAGAPRWAAAAIAVGALSEGAGFATSTKALVATSFAILFAGLLPAVRALRTATRPHPAAEPASALT